MGAIRRDFQGGQLGHLTISESRTHGDDSKSKKSSKKVSITIMGFYRSILFLAICLVFKFVAAQNEGCTTPDRRQGDCINIRQCELLLKILTKRPLKGSDANFLRMSQCGFDGSDPKVCCPSQGSGTGVTPDGGDKSTGGDGVVATPVRSNLLPNKKMCGISIDGKIYGGTATELDEFPWMALLEYQLPDGSRGFYCGGVLISKRYVLTAAHCLKGKSLPRTWRLVSVRLGEYDTDTDVDCLEISNRRECADPAVDVPVEDRIAHEDYNAQDLNQYNDIALLRLARDVQFTDFVKPICLPTTSEDLSRMYVGQDLFVAGWGKTENSSESNVKLKVQVPVKSNSDCAPTYNTVRVRIGSGQLCAGGERGKDSCRGDSGGPLMSSYTTNRGDANWYAAGIVSFGPTPCGFENWPGIYTRVANYMQWIVGKIKE